MKTYIKTDTHLYTLTRGQFAKEQGLSTDAIKKRMSRGMYKDSYIYIKGQYKFISCYLGKKDSASQPGLLRIPLSPVKAKRNRGNHETAIKKGNYPNVAFANHNHMKKLIALRGKLSPEELALVPDVERMVKQERRKQLEESIKRENSSNNVYKNYGTGIFNIGSNKGYGTREYFGGAVDASDRRFEPTNRGKPDKKKSYY
ncbi:MAG: hypothetical protein O2871_02510 [bacterium]|nr:hypothetical protein [bacterium]